MSFTGDPGKEMEEVVKLSTAEVKKYEAQFSQSVVRFSNLQLKECIGEGIIITLYNNVLKLGCCNDSLHSNNITEAVTLKISTKVKDRYLVTNL